jgi:ribosomal protein L20A (L18A)
MSSRIVGGWVWGWQPHSRENSTVQKPYKECRMESRRQPCKQNKDKHIMSANWNVRSLYRPGTLAKLKEELNRYKIAIAAVQEIRWSEVKSLILEIL